MGTLRGDNGNTGIPEADAASVADGAGGNDIALQDAVQKLAEEFQLTPEEFAQRLPSGQTFIYNRTGWAKTELVKAGLIDQPRRGLFRITECGEELLANPPPAITRA